jgi:hypothetical protein
MPSYSHDQQQAVSIYPAIWNDVRDSKALIKARKRSDVCEDRKKKMRLSVPPHGVRHPSKVSNSIAQPMVSLICGLQASTDRRAVTGNKLLRDARRKVHVPARAMGRYRRATCCAFTDHACFSAATRRRISCPSACHPSLSERLLSVYAGWGFVQGAGRCDKAENMLGVRE